MLILQAVLCLAVGLPSQPVDAIECYTCADATHIPDCTQSVTCSYDSTCFSEYTEVKGSGLYTLGCKPSLVSQYYCSSGQTCQDDHGYNCALVATQFDICNDVSHSKVHCRKYCGFCSIVDGSWSTWSAWSSCDVTCGTGTTSRHRTCSDPAPANGGDDCLGSMADQKNCTRNTCPVHGGWSQWSQWGTCSSSCDIGLQRRDHSCSNPYPAHFGESCYGESRDDQLCFPGACANGGWSNWGAWSTCTITCGGGVSSRSRQCDNPTPSMTGVYCTGDPVQAESCNTSPCQGPTVLFHVRDVSPQPTANSVIKFKNVVENVGSAYDTATGCFTAPARGRYWLSAQLCSGTNQLIIPSLIIRGTVASRGFERDADYASCGSVTAVATLKVGDTVCLKSGPYQHYDPMYSDDHYNTNNFMGAIIN